MAINLKVAEDFLVEQLTPLQAKHNITIERLHDKVFNRAVSVSNLFVNFVGTEAQDQLTFNRQYTKRIKYEVLIRLQDLRSHARAYPIMKDVEERLVGKEPVVSCTKPIALVEQKFLADLVADGLWVYSLLFDFNIYEA